MQTLRSIEEVIEKLGGPKAVAELTNRTGSPSVVPNWVKRNKLPAKTFTTMQAALQARGLSAPNDLWGMP
jgi:hypothetical protein